MAYNILIVDDSSVVRKVLIKSFSMTDVVVKNFHQANNGQEALDILSNNSEIDLIFLDINMPIMNGIEFMRVFHSRSDLNKIPVIVVSTEGSQQRVEELQKLGVSAYLRKPVAPEILVKTVKEIFSEIKR